MTWAKINSSLRKEIVSEGFVLFFILQFMLDCLKFVPLFSYTEHRSSKTHFLLTVEQSFGAYFCKCFDFVPWSSYLVDILMLL